MTSRLFVALDHDTAEEAVRAARNLADHVAGFKVGLRLLHGPGPLVISAIAKLGIPVFADAKLHDIPSQVTAAAARLGDAGARWVTAHASGGTEMLAAANEGLRSTNPAGGILGVTVLTSLDSADVERLAPGTSAGRLTSRLTKLVSDAGCEGVVCAPTELGVVKQVAPSLVAVVPGIRLENGEVSGEDQKRTSTPGQAAKRGADYLVVGRAIVEASDPVAMAISINEQVESALASQ